jgi:hypothetical protein
VSVLLASPSWFVHYASFSAAPIALVVGAAYAAAIDRLEGWQRGGLREQRLRPVLAVLVAAALVGLGLPVAVSADFGARFPGAKLAAALQTTSGCVTTDDPTALIESNTLQRNLDRRCRFVVDLGGYSYDLPGHGQRPNGRAHDPVWQSFVLAYLRSGQRTVLLRFPGGASFSSATARTVNGWPSVARVGKYWVREPR